MARLPKTFHGGQVALTPTYPMGQNPESRPATFGHTALDVSLRLDSERRGGVEVEWLMGTVPAVWAKSGPGLSYNKSNKVRDRPASIVSSRHVAQYENIFKRCYL